MLKRTREVGRAFKLKKNSVAKMNTRLSFKNFLKHWRSGRDVRSKEREREKKTESKSNWRRRSLLSCQKVCQERRNAG